MKRVSRMLSLRLIISLLLLVLLSVSGAWATPTTPDQAQKVVKNWLGLEARPMGASLGQQIKEVQTFNYEGTPAYYVVYLNPAGFVIVSADDLVEPIIGFLPEGQYDPSQTNPLGALVSNDIPGRVLQARQVEAKGLEALAPGTPQALAQRKWAWLSDAATGQEALEFGLPTISDVRVTPLVQSRWNQLTVDNSWGGLPCYNYYTPYSPSEGVNHVCGCVATAMSQLMRYWQYPTTGVGTASFQIMVDGVYQSANLRGGNGTGGAYDWSSMVLDPLHYSGITDAQRRAIGSLTSDAGVSVNMDYETAALGGAGADTLAAGHAFTNTFMYSNARTAYSGSNIPDANRNAMVNPNLHAQYPVLFGITGNGGHAIVCDGYGYNSSTMYHHLNMGWAGTNDAWYNLPNINTSYGTWTSVYKCIYNVYKPGTGAGSGEIIAGRVTDGTNPISGAAVTASRTGGGSYSTTTDANGIYALAQVSSASNYTVSVTKAGFTFTPQIVSTTISINGVYGNPSIACGNLWGVDFAGVVRKSGLAPLYELLLME